MYDLCEVRTDGDFDSGVHSTAPHVLQHVHNAPASSHLWVVQRNTCVLDRRSLFVRASTCNGSKRPCGVPKDTCGAQHAVLYTPAQASSSTSELGAEAFANPAMAKRTRLAYKSGLAMAWPAQRGATECKQCPASVIWVATMYCRMNRVTTQCIVNLKSSHQPRCPRHRPFTVDQTERRGLGANVSHTELQLCAR